MKAAQFESWHLTSLLPGTVLRAPHLSCQFTLILQGILSVLPPRKLRLQKPANLHEGRWQVGGNGESRTQTIPAAPPDYWVGQKVHSGLSRTSATKTRTTFLANLIHLPTQKTQFAVSTIPNPNSTPQRKVKDTSQWILIVWGVHSCEFTYLISIYLQALLVAWCPHSQVRWNKATFLFLFFLSFKIKSHKKLVFQTGVTRSIQLLKIYTWLVSFLKNKCLFVAI